MGFQPVRNGDDSPNSGCDCAPSSSARAGRPSSRGFSGPLERVGENLWRIPKSYKPGMRVDGLIFADERLIESVRSDQAAEQVANVAFLPGIQGASLAMPDIHWGYGFCIGGVCATAPEEGGVISPGGVGYDINCGVRLVRTNLTEEEVRPRLKALIDQLFRDVPTGTGRGGKYRFNPDELRRLMREGVPFLRKRGLATDADIEHTEASGCITNAEPENVSERALQRGEDQCGTVGSGNHFLEVQVVDHLADQHKAEVMGLRPGRICILIHSGSRGLGYQVCDDALKVLRTAPEKYGIDLPDRQLACAPLTSPEGRHYLGAMRAAANYAFCNRQLLMWQVREVFERLFGRAWDEMGIELVYDVAHNIAKFEEHQIPEHGLPARAKSKSGSARAGSPCSRKMVCVHRKGATRAFPPGHPELPARYGQPVIIPGDMGRASWLLAGAAGSMTQSFGTTCHGAGRLMSRTAAVKEAAGRSIANMLLEQGVYARSQSKRGLAEEQPKAYKDVDVVVDVVHNAGLSVKVARLRPLGVIKG